jgi:hypothetical protein
MSHRFNRALENGAWVFAAALVLLSAWGAGRGVCQMMTLLREQAALSEQLAQLEGYALTMERSLLGLAHADDPKVRYVGYDPQSLYRTLQEAHRGAGACIEALEARTTQGVALETYTALVRLQAVWQRVDAALSDYLRQGHPMPISLTTLRAFSFEGQTSLSEATRDFRRADQRERQAAWERTLWELVGYFVLQMAGAGLVIWLLWRRWGAPAMGLQRALQQPSHAHLYTARLQNVPSGANSTSGCASTSNACEKWSSLCATWRWDARPRPSRPPTPPTHSRAVASGCCDGWSANNRRMSRRVSLPQRTAGAVAPIHDVRNAPQKEPAAQNLSPCA